MRFGLLGSLTIERGEGQAVLVTAAKQRAVVAALLLQPNVALPIDTLIDVLWDGRPPASARATLLNYVTRLRRGFGADIGERLHTTPVGYRLDIHGNHELDYLEAGALETRSVTAARAGDWDRVDVLTRHALDLWRGEPLEDVAATRLHRDYVHQLVSNRSRLHDLRIDALLHLGQHDLAAGQLDNLIQLNPLREAPHERLLVALYGCGRRADALESFRATRRLLRDELGVDPSVTYQTLQRQVLNGAPVAELLETLRVGQSPMSAIPPAISAIAAAPVPRQIPFAVSHFVGRGRELEWLSSLLVDSTTVADACRIALVVGTAGVGKTTLAARWAHRTTASFPDGQLYVDLHGHDATDRPTSTDHAVQALLETLGVAPEQMPSTLQARIGLYRSLVTDRRLLLVLDNARSAEQVRPLLPGSPTCRVLVTSRLELASLVAIEGAHRVKLGHLSTAEARELLVLRLGSERVATQEDALEEIIERCVRLPLALVVAGARAVSRPGLQLAVLADELDATRRGLGALDGGDAASNVRAVFSWSYQQLPAAAARLFRFLGLHPGSQVTASAAASLAGVTHHSGQRLLAELAGANLVAEEAPGRYTLHNLLQAFASELAHENDCPVERRAVLHRVLDHYLCTADRAAVRLYPRHHPVALAECAADIRVEDFDDHAAALAWFHAERDVLSAAIAAADAAGFDEHTWRLTQVQTYYLNRCGQWQHLQGLCRLALPAAERLGDTFARASIHRLLGRTHSFLGQHDEALVQLHRSLGLYDHTDHHPGLATVHQNLSCAYSRIGNHAKALEHDYRALRYCRLLGDEVGLATVLNGIGSTYSKLGNDQRALGFCTMANRLLRGCAEPAREAQTWDSLGLIHHHLADHGQAAAAFTAALELFERDAVPYDTAATLTRLGDTHAASGDQQAAATVWFRALTIFEQLNHRLATDVRRRLDACMAGELAAR